MSANRAPLKALTAVLCALGGGVARAAAPVPTPLPAAPGTETEPNDSLATANEIASGERIRGSVFGLAGIFGSIGILTENLLGGWLYDVWTRAAPFLVIGACNLVVLGFALFVRLHDRARG